MKNLFTLILFTIGVTAYSQDWSIVASSSTAASGTLTEIEISAGESFNNINNISGTITWDPAVATYSSISYFGLFNPVMSMSDFNITNVDLGQITFDYWSTFTIGPSLGDGDVMFTIEFLAVGATGTSTDIDFSNIPQSLSYFTGFGGSGSLVGTSGTLTIDGLNITGCYDPPNWTSNTENTNGSVTHASGVITMTGDNDQTGNGTVGIDCAATQGNVTHCVTIPNSGTVTFDWDYGIAPIDSADVDAFGYCLDGVAVQLALKDPPPFGTPNGSASFEVTANSELCFVISSENAWLPNAPVVTISNFTGPPCELPSLTAEIVQNDLVGCVGEANASLEVILEFANEPVTYDWGDNSLEGSNPTGLAAGTYCVTVIDAVPDTAYVCYEIIEAETPMTASAISNPDDGTGTGMALVTVGGGLAPYTITWDTDPVQTGPIAQGLENGVYTYTIVDEFNCIIIQQIVVIFVGIEEITGLQNFDFYPNPTEGMITLNIEFDRTNDFQIYMLNAVGQKVIDLGSNKGNQFQKTIDLSSLPSGFYYLNLEVDGYKSTKKVIIK